MYYNSMNRYPVPDLVTAFYANPNPITYTVIPYLMGRFLVNDYGMGGETSFHRKPIAAIDSFMSCYDGDYKVEYIGYFVCLRKVW